MAENNIKIFKRNRIRLEQLKEDAFNYLKDVYSANNEEFSMASPFAQIINVTINLARMILFYIETSITELNIETAYQTRSIRGLATLTGHEPSRGISARGSLYMSYNNSGDHAGETIFINNMTHIKNTSNGLTYLAVLPTSTMQLTVGAFDSKIEIPIIQGTLKYQQATGTGEALQSFNFANKSGVSIDNFFINVYVNGTRWNTVSSILDMTYEQEACVVKTSLNGGVDVFFGTGNNGKIPVLGATILCEYLVTNGEMGNINSTSADNYWEFDESGYDINGDYLDLNSIYVLTSASDVIFGTGEEDLELTRQLAPNMSRSFVLANAINYETYLKKLNMFTIIDAYSGFNTIEDNKKELAYMNAKAAYESIKQTYYTQVQATGKDSAAAKEIYSSVVEAQKIYELAKLNMEESSLDDNTVYLYLVPDITKRLSSNENYFTCSTSRFTLTNDEKTGILNLIENSGQKVLTVENKIIDPIFVKFAVNIFVQIFTKYDFNSIKSAIISALSEYFINTSRRDRYPISDIIKIVENIDGVDSVTAFFDPDVTNEKYFGLGNYGIDEFGDIVLTRTVQDKLGNNVELNDLRPLFRGGFTSPSGIEYEDGLEGILCPVNITLRGRS